MEMGLKGTFILLATYVCACAAASVSPACMCVRNYQPVCGSDGNTYSNECMLKCAKNGDQDLALAKTGRCETEEAAAQNCICTFEYKPVCGTDGITYPNRCSLGCQRSVQVRHEGDCNKQKREVTQPPCVCTREMKQVCGSDGKTYGNPCMLNCATIRNPTLGIDHNGPCSEVKVVDQPDGTPNCACTRNLRPVCGSDGVTYNNLCVLTCSGKDVTLDHEGPC